MIVTGLSFKYLLGIIQLPKEMSTYKRRYKCYKIKSNKGIADTVP